MIRREPNLTFSTISQAVANPSYKCKATDEFYFGYARQALLQGFLALGMKPGDVVLYPDFICDVTIAPCRFVGLRVKYYSTTDSLEPVWNEIEALLAKGAKAILSINYFGFPANMERFREIADKYGVYWIEDNAHGFGGRYRGLELGSFGDISICSPRKSLPLLNGAFLKINSPDKLSIDPFHSISFKKLRKGLGKEELHRTASLLLRLFKVAPSSMKAPELFSEMEEGHENDHRFYAMDPFSFRLFSVLRKKREEFAAIRQSIYAEWLRINQELGLQPVFENVPSGISPLVFPCYAHDFKERQKWIKFWRDNNVDVYPWPSLPEAQRKPGSNSMLKWSRILCFPVHQGMVIEDIVRCADKV